MLNFTRFSLTDKPIHTMRTIYSALFLLLTPFFVVRLCWRSRKLPAYRHRIAERFAAVPTPPKSQPCIWVHAASVGEFIAFKPIVDEMLSWGSHAVYITTMTPTGSARVVETYGERVGHSYVPYDIGFLISKFLHRVQPTLAIFVETELWPNTLYHCKKQGVITLLANGRLSEKSLRGYRRLSWLSRPMIASLSCSAIQYEADAQRFKTLGLNPETCLVSGSIKFDIELNMHTIESAKFLYSQIQQGLPRKIFVAGSTHKGEEEIILSAYRQIKMSFPSCLLIMVPRHPDRFSEVAALCESWGYKLARRSDQQAPVMETDVLLADTMGELLMLYGCSHVAFVGGSLIDRGGHNYLEAAAWGLPIISGPSTFNFAAISDMLEQANAMFIADSDKLIAAEVLKLFSNEELAKRKGLAGAKIVKQNRGAKAKLILLIKGLLNLQ